MIHIPSIKEMSIKLKVTLWYTCFITAITLISFAFLLISYNQMTDSMMKEELASAVNRVKYGLSYDGQRLIIPNEDIDKIENTAILLYDMNQHLIYGKTLSALADRKPMGNKLQTFTVDGTKYYVYDYLVTFHSHDDVWIRGVISLNSIQLASNSLIKLAAISFPFLILLSAIGGYLITKKAFKPVAQITSLANEISGSCDLSKRIYIPLQKVRKDEISTLAETFNDMFERLQTSFENERQFTSDASHELRTPTTVIMAQAEYLLSICHTEREHKAASAILKQTNRMSELIAELLMLARMDHNKQQLNFELIDLSEMLEIVLDELSYTSTQKNILFYTDIQDSLYLHADQTMMMRMLINLISNAIKYGRNDGWIHIILYRENNTIIGKISDNGIGIAKEHLDKIWDRFYQVDSARTHDGGSSGLGLSMVKWIVSAHHGTIHVTSELGVGSTFTFQFPVQ